MRKAAVVLFAFAVVVSSGCEKKEKIPPITIATTSLPDAVEGTFYSYTVTAAGGRPAKYQWSATGLPTGLDIDSATGEISGTPVSGTAGSYAVTVTVTDGDRTAQQNFTLTVWQRLRITTTSLPDGYEGETGYSATLSASGGSGANYVWSMSGTLPANLSWDASTATISGNIATGTAGDYPLQFEVTDGIQTVTADLILTVHAQLQITTTSLSAGYDGQAGYSAALTAAGGTGTYSWSIVSGDLPPKLALDTSTGVISGDIASDASTGSPYNFTVEVTDGQQSVRADLSITVYEELQITTTSLPDSYEGETGYSATLSASGGSGANYVWSMSGTLPANLSWDASTATISGNIATGTAGDYPLQFEVTDGIQTVTADLILTVHAQLQITTTSLSAGYDGQAGYSAALTAAGGTGTYSWSIVSGDLPPKLALDTSTGVISGDIASDASTGSPYNFTVEVTDGQQSVRADLSITVYERLRVTTTSLPDAYKNTPYSYTVQADGGDRSGYLWSISGQPSWLSIDATTGELSGTPVDSAGTYTFTVTVDDGLQSASRTLDLTVNPATWYVDAVNGDDSHKGTSWGNALATIAKALSVATDGDTILVADATYNETNLNFNGKKIYLKGVDYHSGGLSRPVVDCQGNGRAFYFGSGETEDCVVENFVIRNGRVENTYGGAILCENNSSPTIKNCVFENNEAVDTNSSWDNEDGGAICCKDFSSPRIINCVFHGNSASDDGGAICCDSDTSPQIIDCSFGSRPLPTSVRVFTATVSAKAVGECASRVASNEIIVRLKPGFEGCLDRVAAVVGAVRRKRIHKDSRGLLALLRLPAEARLQNAIQALKKLPFVKYAEPNRLVRLCFVPDDPLYNSSGTWGQSYQDQWGLYKLNAEAAWDTANGSGVVVAVVDTGCDINHPDLKDNIWTNPGEIAGNGIDDDGNGYVDDVHGWDFYDDDATIEDTNGHGTACASVICAVTNNAVGMAGLAYGAKIMPLRALPWVSDIVEAIYYAADNGARVISCSFGGGYSEAEQDAIEYAVQKGCIVVASAGNDADNGDGIHYPSSFRATICVSATDVNDQRASFSNWGTAVDVAAPGCDVLCARASGTAFGLDVPGYPDYCRAYGTSLSAPFVSAIAALLLSKDPSLTPYEVRTMIRASSTDLGSSGFDLYFGYGRVDAAAALSQERAAVWIHNLETYFLVKGKVEVKGTVQSANLSDWTLYVGEGETPSSWQQLSSGSSEVNNETLVEWDTTSFDDGFWTLKLVLETTTGAVFEDRVTVYVGNKSNTAGGHGGAIYCASGSLTMTDCAFSGNSANWYGGAICCWVNSSPTVTNCTFVGNNANYGGAIYCWDSSMTLTNCAFRDNSADSGGAIYCEDTSSSTVTNCTFSGNSADYGGAIYCHYDSSPILNNCILWGNSADSGGNEIYIEDSGSSCTLNYCCVDNTGYGGVTGNITENNCIHDDPQFVDAANGDYHLQDTSPCIDAGDNSLVPADVTTDLDGNQRIVDGDDPPDGVATVDIGAYEYQP